MGNNNKAECVDNMNESERESLGLGYILGRYLDLGIRTMIICTIVKISNIFN
jgi:hypothetical protein